ncbi:MAG: DUF2786 domain-containing protein [Hyphomicrobium sp.]
MNTDAAKRAKIIEKVRALLSMTTANGCTEAEALTAAGMASKLMEEYDLALGDVRSIEDERIAQQSKPFSSAERPREMHAAGIYVAPAVGEFFDCRIWRSYSDIIFFGLRDDVELAHIMLAMIRFAMDRELSDFMKTDAAKAGEHPRSLAASFLRGMGHRINERLRQLKAERTANVRANGKDLVVVKGAIVDAAFAAQYPNLKKARATRPPKSEFAYSAGFEAGDRVNLGHKEVTARPSAKVHARSAWQRATGRPPSVPGRVPAIVRLSYSARATRCAARLTAMLIAYVARVCGFAGALASLIVLTRAFEASASLTTRAGFIDWLVDRQPLWAGIATASIACSIRFERMQNLDERAAIQAHAEDGEWVPSAPAFGTSVHVLYLTALSTFTYFGNRLAPQIRDQFTADTDSPFWEKLRSMAFDDAARWQTSLECVAWIIAGYVIANCVIALDRFGRA